MFEVWLEDKVRLVKDELEGGQLASDRHYREDLGVLSESRLA